MDKIAKFLKKLTAKEQTLVAQTLEKLLAGKTTSLDIKKLTGYSDIFRVRAQDIRIIFKRTQQDIRVLEISRRNEMTYTRQK